jgi:uncharacterized protein
MNQPGFDAYSNVPAAQNVFFQRVYQWMAAGLAVTGFTAYAVAGNTAILQMLAGGGFLLLAIVEIALVVWLSYAIANSKVSTQGAVIGFLVYSLLNGASLSFIFLAYTGMSIATTFFVTAGSFAGVSLFGWATQSDLSSLRGYLVMGLWGIILGSLANFFMKSGPFDWFLTYAGLAIFIGLTAYDTQQLKRIHQENQGTDQIAVLGALRLYLDFINMFLLLLRLFGRRRD